MSKVVVAGTFNVFHRGHQKLMNTAITLATLKNASLMVGVTSDTMAQRTRTVPVRPRTERLKDVQDYIENDEFRPEFGPVQYMTVWSSNDMPMMEKNDILVVSEETAGNASRVLFEKGYDCELHVVDMVRDDNGEEIHSTKILERME